jgi:hypothetical protein
VAGFAAVETGFVGGFACGRAEVGRRARSTIRKSPLVRLRRFKKASEHDIRIVDDLLDQRVGRNRDVRPFHHCHPESPRLLLGE